MRLRVVVVSDTHVAVGGRDHTWYNHMLVSRWQDVMAELVAKVNALTPDLVLVCGDLTDQGDEESFIALVEVFRAMQAPVRVTPGNHDIFRGRTGFVHLEKATAGMGNQSFDAGPCHFILLDHGYWIDADGHAHAKPTREVNIAGCGPSEEGLSWLTREVQAVDKPLIVASHFPLCLRLAYSVKTSPEEGQPTNQPFTSWCSMAGYLTIRRDAELAILLGSPYLTAVLSGHTHFHSCSYFGQVLNCSTAAIISYPFEIRIMTIDRSSLIMETCGLENDELEKMSFIPEWDNTWVKGRPDDRYCQISLRRS